MCQMLRSGICDNIRFVCVSVVCAIIVQIWETICTALAWLGEECGGSGQESMMMRRGETPRMCIPLWRESGCLASTFAIEIIDAVCFERVQRGSSNSVHPLKGQVSNVVVVCVRLRWVGSGADARDEQASSYRGTPWPSPRTSSAPCTERARGCTRSVDYRAQGNLPHVCQVVGLDIGVSRKVGSVLTLACARDSSHSPAVQVPLPMATHGIASARCCCSS